MGDSPWLSQLPPVVKTEGEGEGEGEGDGRGEVEVEVTACGHQGPMRPCFSSYWSSSNTERKLRRSENGTRRNEIMSSGWRC